jgi:hypothetical protein
MSVDICSPLKSTSWLEQTVTNTLFIWLGAKGIRSCIQQSHPLIFLSAYVGYIIVGLGSISFHATLKCERTNMHEYLWIQSTNYDDRPNAARGWALHDIHHLFDDVREFLFLTIQNILYFPWNRPLELVGFYYGEIPTTYAKGTKLNIRLALLLSDEGSSLSPNRLCCVDCHSSLSQHLDNGVSTTSGVEREECRMATITPEDVGYDHHWYAPLKFATMVDVTLIQFQG